MLSIRGAAAAVGLVLALPWSAAADPITITSGTFTLGGFARGSFRSFVFSLGGDQDFAITGQNGDTPRQSFLPPCNEFGPCSAGAVTSPSGDLNILGLGDATINGTHYSLTQYFGDPFHFSSGNVVIPDGSADAFSLTSPFTFTGSLDVFAIDASGRSNVGLFSLTGQGTATTRFRRVHNELGDGYAIEGVTFGFGSQTPEPASLLLLGTGSALLIRRKSRREPAAS